MILLKQETSFSIEACHCKTSEAENSAILVGGKSSTMRSSSLLRHQWVELSCIFLHPYRMILNPSTPEEYVRVLSERCFLRSAPLERNSFLIGWFAQPVCQDSGQIDQFCSWNENVPLTMAKKDMLDSLDHHDIDDEGASPLPGSVPPSACLRPQTLLLLPKVGC